MYVGYSHNTVMYQFQENISQIHQVFGAKTSIRYTCQVRSMARDHCERGGVGCFLSAAHARQRIGASTEHNE